MPPPEEAAKAEEEAAEEEWLKKFWEMQRQKATRHEVPDWRKKLRKKQRKRQELKKAKELLSAESKDTISRRFKYSTYYKGKEQEGTGLPIHLAASMGHLEVVRLFLSGAWSKGSEATRPWSAVQHSDWFTSTQSMAIAD